MSEFLPTCFCGMMIWVDKASYENNRAKGAGSPILNDDTETDPIEFLEKIRTSLVIKVHFVM